MWSGGIVAAIDAAAQCWIVTMLPRSTSRPFFSAVVIVVLVVMSPAWCRLFPSNDTRQRSATMVAADGVRVDPYDVVAAHETVFRTAAGEGVVWPYRDYVAVVEGNVTIGGLMMVHERDERLVCGKIMPQGGVQATEAMLYTIDVINARNVIPGVKLGARIKDDCDRDIYGLEQSVDFIRGSCVQDVLHKDSPPHPWLPYS